jgi:protein-tyrosine phosphatase
MNLTAKTVNPADEIVPGLWLGSRYASLDGEYMKARNITTVFNCTKDIPFHDSILRRYRVPVHDNLEDEEIKNLEIWAYEIVYKITTELRKTQKEGGAVLVHCAAGMQRSAACCAMYLIAAYRMSADEAMETIKKKRKIAFFPVANFEPAIRGFEASFTKEILPYLQGSTPRKLS